MVEGTDGWDGVMEGWHVEQAMGRVEGLLRGEVMRGVVGGELWRGWQQSKLRPGGWHGSGASLCPGPSCPSWSLLRTASAACFTCKTHPAERASTHGAKGARRKAFLRQCWEKREGVSSTASLYQCLSQMKPWGDAVIRDERINSLQIILLWAQAHFHTQLMLLFCSSQELSFIYTRPDTVNPTSQ